MNYDSSFIVKENHYYPFGLNMAGIEKQGIPDHKFQYNGKEKQEEFGLNWYDYEARSMDVQLGRFNQIDPHSENYYSLTPYNYVANNPIIYIDPDGRDITLGVGEDDEDRREDLFKAYEKLISDAFGGRVSATVDRESGKVSFSRSINKETGEAQDFSSNGEENAFNLLNDIAGNSDIQVNQTLIDSNSENIENDGKTTNASGILFGSENGHLDLDDIRRGITDARIKDITPARSLLVHETVEQAEMFQNGGDFKPAHRTATEKANTTRDFQRDNTEDRKNPRTKTFRFGGTFKTTKRRMIITIQSRENNTLLIRKY
ncbi:RHS repeat-associated core domain-containing protein [Chondrinema litorale]|uniref:RHS repeat-associated core domain-containing protein n=1 Tax=Chondrinema litorale TaxID=2994555 RepID=UPI002542C4B5|nr:RHS repeat-associated core domain-containing protein [Chondrinema litorale]UZR98930.1 RHS repeat-associated core domain-containing protein [Chondrinema litorale]